MSALALSGVDIGAFDSANTQYAASVANDVEQTTVTPTTSDDGATYAIKLNGALDDETIPLAVGENVIAVEVTSEDEQTTETYTVTVTRAEAPLSTDATLSGLAVSGVDIGAFNPDTTGYTASVGNDVAETAVTANTNDDGATHEVKLAGVAYDGTIPLAVGQNVITVEVTAEDGETAQTYTVTVTRAAPPLSSDATLSGLTLSGADIGDFNSQNTQYTASVANDVDETTVTATTNDDRADYVVKLDGGVDEDRTVSLAVGENVITVVVTAEDGQTTKTYTVTVARAEAPESEVAIELSSDSVEEGMEISVTMSFANLTPDSEANLVFRADVAGADACEGHGIGADRNMSKVDEDPEVRTGTISGDCTAGDYTLEVSLSSAGVELASASAAFTVVVPEPQPEPEPTEEPKPSSPPGVPETPTGEVTGEGRVQLDWNDVAGAAYYQVRFCCGNKDWVELPTDGIEIAINGSEAAVSNLPGYGTYHFSVRAGNAAGLSGWSDHLTLANP